ncbi:hypothetical protein ANCCEY_11918 [Ancylostoma ceylanicum]|uniref:Uncharacterized protein n=1 Tax=Ancylostoma ceylanicum TaxID=53326 RepID=A0A0D6LMX7_9BILA|nr:hypothetical protein ANCCEY_11918 [Ancylostoma ceylanicum]
MPRPRALCTLLLIVLASVARVRGYCNVLDHQACDELCKVDNYWYGHCTAWDGKNFSCKCFEYVAPLDGTEVRTTWANSGFVDTIALKQQELVGRKEASK